MSLLFEPFVRNTFLLRALIAGLLVSVSCGIVGTFIVLRGLAFIGDALAHGVLPGIAVAILLGWRVRWRFMHTSRFIELTCPRCGNDLHRIHRRAGDRMLNLFVPVRRYQCKNRDCLWRGLKVATHQHG